MSGLLLAYLVVAGFWFTLCLLMYGICVLGDGSRTERTVAARAVALAPVWPVVVVWWLWVGGRALARDIMGG